VDKKVRGKRFEKKIKERITGKVDVQLGKNGITEGFLRELKNRLEKHGIVKVRVLGSFRKTYTDDVNAVAVTLAEKTRSRVYEIRGFAIILIKEK